MKTATTVDYTVELHGTLYLVYPENEAAREHLEERVQPDATWWGTGLVVEPRYINELVVGLMDHGFSVGGY